ncbi:hypothetical protein Phum_PHUM522540 [Pediculus humanus corporis]|uniref:Uncharacterized protein n=1 Tax=Pediculus humanus subsp. corporis TaxID=121224 RepID=E0VZ02_PEDHC|nr:uncharacterized protein Phum_PHUM522540 [Pediculus humanus corporis]EEB18608.1 hypothetical protein Phum_PHUM522540 [Pediculus humanus corporis]
MNENILERGCSLASAEGEFNYILKKGSSNSPKLKSLEIKNEAKVVKVLGDEVMVKNKCASFKIPQCVCVREGDNFKIPEILSTPKSFNHLSSYGRGGQKESSSPDECKTNYKNLVVESCKKSSKKKNKDSEQSGKKAPESFLRSLKRRSLRVARSKSWVCTEKRKSGGNTCCKA